MIRRLLLPFKTYPEKYCCLSEPGLKNNAIIANLNFFYANKSLMVFTIGWVLFQVYSFSDLSLRPPELFIQRHYFGKLFMPFFPSGILFYSVGIAAILICIFILFKRGSIALRTILAFSVMWLNLFRWSFGGQGHSGHLLILAHLLGIFIAYKEISFNKDNKEIQKSIEWYYLGLLMTYTYAGLWKCISLIYKVVFKGNEVSWISSKGALYNYLLEYRGADLPIDHPGMFDFPLFWQLSFLFTCFVLTFSYLAAFRQPLRIWIAVAIIVFHLVNNIVFNVAFYTAIWVLVCLFFPYEKVFSRIRNSQIPVFNRTFTGKGRSASYERIYENGDIDRFDGFYAYREKITDRNRIWGGLLYFPFLDSLVYSFWWIKEGLRSKTTFIRS